jgi:hypothetical protein
MRKIHGLAAIALIAIVPKLIGQCTGRAPGLVQRSQTHQQVQGGTIKKIEVTIRLVAARSGKPFKDRDVEIFGTNSCYGLLEEDTIFRCTCENWK